MSSVPQELTGEITPISHQTISTTLADTGTMMVVQPHPSNSVQYAPLPDQTPTKMLERLMEIGTYNWAVGTAPSFTIPAMTLDPFNLLLALPVMADITNWYYYMRSDLEIHFRINSNQFYAGALAISACPGSYQTANTSQQARSWLGHTIMSAVKQDTLVITLPWPLPQRFVPVSGIPIMLNRIWSVYVDILATLNATTASPSNVDVSIFARFVNAQLVLPYQASSLSARLMKEFELGTDRKSSRSLNIRPHSSSGGTIPRPKSARAGRSIVRVSKSQQDPVQEAQSPSTPSPLSTISTLISPITDIIGSMESAIPAIQPIMDIVSSLGGLLDKPEIQNPVERIYPSHVANCSQSDRPDQAFPLTLYQGSYLNIDTSALPGGKSFTILDVATTPCLHAYFDFTNSATSTTIPYICEGTPMWAMKNCHLYWRGSMRYQFRFYCPMFVSTRLLIVISPAGIPVIDAVANNLSMVVDVKGDTVKNITLPFIFITDMARVQDTELYKIQVSVLQQIVTNDTTVTPHVTMIVYSAAGPDSQFSMPITPEPITYIYPDSSVTRVGKYEIKKHASIRKEFEATFEPILMDCTYLSDQRHVTSETSIYITDLLKRYQTAGGVPPLTGAWVLPGDYRPVEGSIGYFLQSMFLFYRGGIKYKFVDVSAASLVVTYDGVTLDPDTWTGQGYGAPTLWASPSTNFELSFAVPWINIVPYSSQALGDNTSFPSQPTPVMTNFSGSMTYADVNMLVAVRDDYQLGFLIPPSWTASSSGAKPIMKKHALRQ